MELAAQGRRQKTRCGRLHTGRSRLPAGRHPQLRPCGGPRRQFVWMERPRFREQRIAADVGHVASRKVDGQRLRFRRQMLLLLQYQNFAEPPGGIPDRRRLQRRHPDEEVAAPVHKAPGRRRLQLLRVQERQRLRELRKPDHFQCVEYQWLGRAGAALGRAVHELSFGL